jgi:hypothetical protein
LLEISQEIWKGGNRMNSYILIGIESFIDHIGCIRDLGIAYWRYNFILKNCYFMGFFKRWGTLV